MGRVDRVKNYFKGACQSFAKKNLSEGIFEGLADIMELPNPNSEKGYPTYFFVGGRVKRATPIV